MSKNLTIKGLALGAVVALGASFFAATPAFAAGEITLAPSAGGTVTKTVEGENFALTAGLAAATPAGNIAQLKYLVSSSIAGLTVSAATGSTTVTSGTATPSTSTTDKVYSFSTAPVAASVNTITLNSGSTALTADSTATVTAFLDANSNGVLDSGEYSAAQTITWVKKSNVKATVALGDLTAGTQDVTATATLTDLNGTQVATNSVDINLYAVASSTPTTALGGTLTHSLVTGLYKKVLSSQALTAGQGIKAEAVLTTNSNAVIGSVTVVPATRTVSSITASVAAGSYATAAGASSNDGDFVIKAVVKDTATTPAVLAGVKVLATVSVASGTTLAALDTADSTKQLTVAGTTYTDKTKLPGASDDYAKLALVSDAKGVVSVTLKSHNFASGDTVTVTFTTQNYSSAATASQAASTTYSVIDVADVNGVNARSIAAAATAAVNYAVVDQFGKAPANAKYRLAVTAPGTTSATTDDIALYLPVVDGKVSASIVDKAASASVTGSYTVTAQLQKVGADGNYSDVSGSVDTFTLNLVASPAAAKVTITSPADSGSAVTGYGTLQYVQTTAGAGTYAKPAIDNRSALLLETEDFAAYDSRTDLSKTATATTAGYEVTVAGAITDAYGSAIAGAPVTVSGSGLEFKAGNVYGVGSISFLAGSAGAYSVDVFSNKSGKQVVTVTSGSATKTVTLTYASAAGKTSELTVPTAAQAGRAIDISATLKDAFGNLASGVSVTFASTGVGYVAASSAVKTDAKGVAATKLIVGAQETGDATVTATFTNAAGDDVVATKTISIGTTDAQIDNVDKRVTAVASYSKGKTVGFYVDGVKKWSKASTSDADVVINYNLKKGRHTVAVKISGGFVTSEIIVVK